MNQRIKELAQQAFQGINDISTEGVADYHTFEQAWFQVYNQKFAELIVQECIQRIDDSTPVYSSHDQEEDYCKGTLNGYESAILEIKETFGVEQ